MADLGESVTAKEVLTRRQSANSMGGIPSATPSSSMTSSFGVSPTGWNYRRPYFRKTEDPRFDVAPNDEALCFALVGAVGSGKSAFIDTCFVCKKGFPVAKLPVLQAPRDEKVSTLANDQRTAGVSNVPLTPDLVFRDAPGFSNLKRRPYGAAGGDLASIWNRQAFWMRKQVDWVIQGTHAALLVLNANRYKEEDVRKAETHHLHTLVQDLNSFYGVRCVVLLTHTDKLNFPQSQKESLKNWCTEALGTGRPFFISNLPPVPTAAAAPELEQTIDEVITELKVSAELRRASLTFLDWRDTRRVEEGLKAANEKEELERRNKSLGLTLGKVLLVALLVACWLGISLFQPRVAGVLGMGLFLVYFFLHQFTRPTKFR